MKILKQGTPPINDYIHVFCGNCESEFEFERAELVKTTLNKAGELGKYLYTNCPICNCGILHPNIL